MVTPYKPVNRFEVCEQTSSVISTLVEARVDLEAARRVFKENGNREFINESPFWIHPSWQELSGTPRNTAEKSWQLNAANVVLSKGQLFTAQYSTGCRRLTEFIDRHGASHHPRLCIFCLKQKLNWCSQFLHNYVPSPKGVWPEFSAYGLQYTMGNWKFNGLLYVKFHAMVIFEI